MIQVGKDFKTVQRALRTNTCITDLLFKSKTQVIVASGSKFVELNDSVVVSVISWLGVEWVMRSIVKCKGWLAFLLCLSNVIQLVFS